ncbi:MAG: hypothetical protein ACFFFG_16365 [Candidatus Thorarchaeota archaeon]
MKGCIKMEHSIIKFATEYESQIKKGLLKAEKILKNSDPDLFQVISLLGDQNRVEAAIVMFAIMRVVDNIVDKQKLSGMTLDKEEVLAEFQKWELMVEKSYSGDSLEKPLALAFFNSLQKFPIPKKL